MTGADNTRDPAAELEALTRSFERLTEPLRREIANQHRDEVVEGSAQPVRRRRLDVVQSVRLTADAAAEHRAAAERMGFRGLSDLYRAVARAAIQPTGFRCAHAEVTCGPGFVSMQAACGCQMEPVYTVTAATVAAS